MRPWVVAARPTTLWAAITPVVVGNALAEHDGVLRPLAALATLVVAVAMQVGVNIANDVADAATGADNPSRLGPPRAVAGGLLLPRQAWRGVVVAFGVAGIAASYLFVIAGWVVALIGVAAVAAALGYTSGPRYGYHGLGELFVFAFFGPVATVGTRYVHDSTAGAGSWPLSVAIGLLITAILVANNLRDIPTDAEAGKRTLAVVMGTKATRALYAACIVGALVVIAVAPASGWAPRGAWLGLLAVPAVARLFHLSRQAITPAEHIAVLQATSRTQAAIGLLIATGLIWLS